MMIPISPEKLPLFRVVHMKAVAFVTPPCRQLCFSAFVPTRNELARPRPMGAISLIESQVPPRAATAHTGGSHRRVPKR